MDAQACDFGMLPPNMSTSLVQEAMTPIEWSVMKSTLDLFQAVGSSEALMSTVSSITSLAAVLADVWFYPRRTEYDTSVQTTSGDDVDENRYSVVILS